MLEKEGDGFLRAAQNRIEYNMRFRLFFAALMALATSLFGAGPELGKPAPNFTLKDTANTPRSLSDFTGKFVVLEWVNYECPFVKKYYDSRRMQELQKSETGKGVIWLSICSSAPERPGNLPPREAARISSEYGSAASDYLIDANGKVASLYDARTTPEMYIVNPKGVLIYKGAIDDRPSAKQITLTDATNYVELALDEAMAGKSVSNPLTKAYGCPVKNQKAAAP